MAEPSRKRQLQRHVQTTEEQRLPFFVFLREVFKGFCEEAINLAMVVTEYLVEAEYLELITKKESHNDLVLFVKLYPRMWMRGWFSLPQLLENGFSHSRYLTQLCQDALLTGPLRDVDCEYECLKDKHIRSFVKSLTRVQSVNFTDIFCSDSFIRVLVDRHNRQYPCRVFVEMLFSCVMQHFKDNVCWMYVCMAISSQFRNCDFRDAFNGIRVRVQLNHLKRKIFSRVCMYDYEIDYELLVDFFASSLTWENKFLLAVQMTQMIFTQELKKHLKPSCLPCLKSKLKKHLVFSLSLLQELVKRFNEVSCVHSDPKLVFPTKWLKTKSTAFSLFQLSSHTDEKTNVVKYTVDINEEEAHTFVEEAAAQFIENLSAALLKYTNVVSNENNSSRS